MRSSWMKDAACLLDCLATSYRLDLDGAEYVAQLAEAAASLLDRGLGVIAYTYDARDRARPTIDHFAVSKRFDPSWLPSFDAAIEAAALDVGSPSHPAGFHVWEHMLCGQASAVPKMRSFLPLFAHLGGARDAFAVNALDASGQGLWLGAPLPSTVREPREQFTLFTRFAAHLTSAVRLRRSATKPRPAAILAPSGALLHAEEGEEGVVDAREDLRRAALAFDEARTKKMRDDVDLATRRWRPLVLSRWSLLDDFDSDGRRFVVAVANPPPTRPPRNDLSEREHQVLTQAHMGRSTKSIAYELGLSDSTVRVLLHRAARKLGASTREDALARFAALASAHDREEPEP
ncbi:MAG: helix-turn-helix transcriptional regulator [Labilithrix sp.]|nr:helix-turn-helix transcriptional regulator [Labilithrix sp.]MCW5809431.1 helix-turn-helix transcriptional regulator [Labilithrix sp.]